MPCSAEVRRIEAGKYALGSAKSVRLLFLAQHNFLASTSCVIALDPLRSSVQQRDQQYIRMRKKGKDREGRKHQEPKTAS
jgi:hypothetical protein